MDANKHELPPPSYDEAQRYPQFDIHGQSVSNLGPPLSQTGSIFTYNTPTTDHQETYSTEPGGPPPLTGIPPRAPGAPPPEYAAQTNLMRNPHTYGAEFGAHFGGFGVSPPTQYGPEAPRHHTLDWHSYTTQVQTGHQGAGMCPSKAMMTTVYRPQERTAQTHSMPPGYNTTPLAYCQADVTTTEGRKHRKIAMLIACLIVVFITVISTFFGMFI